MKRRENNQTDADVTHANAAHTDAVQADTVHADTVHADTVHADTVHADTVHADASHTDPPHADAGASPPPSRFSPKRTWAKRILIAFTVLLLLAVLLGTAAFLVAWYRFNGEALANYLSENFNRKHRGRLVLGKVTWTPSAVWDLLTGSDHRVVVEEIRIYDSRGQLALYVPRAVGKGRLWPLIRHGDFDLRSAHAKEALVVLDRYRRPEGPSITGKKFEIGLVGAFKKPRLAKKKKKKKKKHRSLIRVDYLQVDRVLFQMHMGGTDLELKDALLKGSITARGKTHNKGAEVLFDAALFAPTGHFRLGARKLALTNVQIKRAYTLPSRKDDLDAEMQMTVEQTEVSANARLINLYAKGAEKKIKASLTVAQAGSALRKLTRGHVYGQNASVELKADGAIRNPEVEARISGVQARYKQYALNDLQALLKMKERTISLVSAQAGAFAGKLHVSGNYMLDRRIWDAKLRVDELHTHSLFSGKKARRQWSGVLSGAVVTHGTVAGPRLFVDDLDLRYRLSRPLKGIGRNLRASGRLTAQKERIDVRSLNLNSGNVGLAANGKVLVESRELRLGLRATGNRLQRLLRRLKAPPVASSAVLAGRVSGKFKNPYFSGKLEVDGVGHRPRSRGRLVTNVELAGGTVRLKKLRAFVYRGGVYGSGRIDLYRRRIGRFFRNPRLRADLTFDGLSLRRLTGSRKIHGRLSGGGRLRGTLRRPKGRLWAKAPHLRLARHRYRNGQVEVSFKKGDVHLDYAGLERRHGGRMRAWGVYRKGGGVDLTGQIQKVPLAGIPGLDKIAPRQVSGLLSGQINLTGTRSWPIVSGSLKLLRSKVRGILLGRADVKIEPAAEASEISGDLFRYFDLSGHLALRPRLQLALSVSFKRFPIQKLVPEMNQVADAHGYVSGKMTMTLDKRGVAEARLKLSEVRVTMVSPAIDPTLPPEKIQVFNKAPIDLVYNGKKLVFRSFHLTGAAGDFKIGGWLSPRDSRLALSGRVGLKPLELFLPERIDSLAGSVLANITVRGPPKKPRINGTVKLSDTTVLLAERDTPVVIPAGTITISDRGKGFDLLALSLNKLRVQIGSETLYADGDLNLKKGKPSRFKLRLFGAVSGKALEVAAPKTISRATGRAKVDVRISGTPKNQSIWGTAELQRTELNLRGIRRELVIQSGQLNFDGTRLTVREFRGRVDDGYLQANGHAIFSGTHLSEVDFKISGQNIPYRKPRVFDVEASAQLRLTGDREGITLSGQIDVLDGRYIQKFDVVRRAFLKKRVYEGSATSWKDNPMLANLALNLSVATSGNVFIQNNIADIRLDGSVYIGGRLAEPKLGGQVHVDQGTFRIPFMRGTYAVRTGEIDFNRGEEPYLRLIGETTVRDNADTEHLITLTLEGFLSEIRINFTSDTNLPKSQILLLLAAGRTTDAIRQDLRGGGDAGAGTGRTGSALDVYDPMLKQVSGDFLSDLVAKPIKNITRLDLFRLELGTSAVQLRMEKRLGRYFKLIGETEFGLMGRQRQEGRLEGKFHDNVYVDIKGRRLIPGEDVFEEEDPLQGRIQLRYKVRFKGGLIRSLGF